jgi:4-aminobutyrate aminotransferase-like enzyme
MHYSSYGNNLGWIVNHPEQIDSEFTEKQSDRAIRVLLLVAKAVWKRRIIGIPKRHNYIRFQVPLVLNANDAERKTVSKLHIFHDLAQ